MAPGMMNKSSSLPFLPGHTIRTNDLGRSGSNRFRPQTLAYEIGGVVDKKKPGNVSDEIRSLASTIATDSGWRLRRTGSEMLGESLTGDQRRAQKEAMRNTYRPKNAPAWLKHDRQVLRFECYFQEGIVEKNGENYRYRRCEILFYLEDGTMQIVEPKVENCGLPQGALVKRHVVPLPDGSGVYTPADLKCGTTIEVYKKFFRIFSCDAFTRWFLQEVGGDAGEEESMPLDSFATKMEFKKKCEQKAFGIPREVVEGQHYFEVKLGGARKNNMLEQFLKNDRKVLRFYGYWDDLTRYGSRNYYTVNYFLADNTVEILERVARNSGRDPYSKAYKRAPLKKVQVSSFVPGMMTPDPEVYLPEDFNVGSPISWFGRVLNIYDCDDSTRHFYKVHFGIDQGSIVIPNPAPQVVSLEYPPHTGVGSEEDSLASVLNLRPKIPQKDVVKLMTNTGKILRFEARMLNGLIEDVNRRFIIGFYLVDDTVACWELRTRNSGFMEGKFAERRLRVNPKTGMRFKPKDFFVGSKDIVLCAAPFEILKTDEYSLKLMEEVGGDMFPMCDINTVLGRIAGLKSDQEFSGLGVVRPEQLQTMALEKLGVELADQELITILRKCGEAGDDPVIPVANLMDMMP